MIPEPLEDLTVAKPLCNSVTEELSDVPLHGNPEVGQAENQFGQQGTQRNLQYEIKDEKNLAVRHSWIFLLLYT